MQCYAREPTGRSRVLTIWRCESRNCARDEINRLAEIGALNGLNELHRRAALWQAQRAIRPVGPLLAHLEQVEAASPLSPMNIEERLWADYRGTGLTVGRHPMAHRRAEMNALGVIPAIQLAQIPNGRLVRRTPSGRINGRATPGWSPTLFL
jgi:error-prone DNA polymerase